MSFGITSCILKIIDVCKHEVFPKRKLNFTVGTCAKTDKETLFNPYIPKRIDEIF